MSNTVMNGITGVGGGIIAKIITYPLQSQTRILKILDNVFFHSLRQHPQFHVFLKQVVGLDLVDDESKPKRRTTKHMPTPSQWTNIFNPAFSYYVYYCYANLYTLNKLRESKGMTRIRFRLHCGEAGDIDHLVASFLTTHNIAHIINLRKFLVLQYLYYLAQWACNVSLSRREDSRNKERSSSLHDKLHELDSVKPNPYGRLQAAYEVYKEARIRGF
ncbi:hypothetical protein Lser_V15G37924 [Lactuca serriola]